MTMQRSFIIVEINSFKAVIKDLKARSLHKLKLKKKVYKFFPVWMTFSRVDDTRPCRYSSGVINVAEWKKVRSKTYKGT